MRRVNLFAAENFIEPEKNDPQIGLVDAQNGSVAYTTTEDKGTWVARIENDTRKVFRFVPIDHNPSLDIRRENGDMESTCDGMIVYDAGTSLAFVELKEVKKGGAATARGQLETTIGIFLENHDYRQFHRRFAYAANKKHPHFNYSNKILMQDFHKRSHFRLLEQSNISLTQGENIKKIRNEYLSICGLLYM